MNYYDRLYNLILEERIEEAFWPKITEPIAPTFHADAVARRGGDAGKAWVTRMERMERLGKGGGGGSGSGVRGRAGPGRVPAPPRPWARRWTGSGRTFWRNPLGKKIRTSPLGKKIRTSPLGRVVRKFLTPERPTYPPGYPYTPPKAPL